MLLPLDGVGRRKGWKLMNRRLGLIGAPTSAGAYAPGQERAPAAFRAHGLVEAIRRTGREVRDLGDVEGFRWRPDVRHPKAMNLEAVRRVANHVSNRVADALRAGDLAVVLGGDCTIELGSVSGALGESRSVGLIYIDLDSDLNPPDASDGALDWTGVAHLLDVDGVATELSAIGPRRPMLSDRDVLYLAVDPITQTEIEKSTMASRNLRCIELEEVHREPDKSLRQATEWGQTFERVAIHLDVDVLSFAAFPIAENVRRQDGLTLQEMARILKRLLALPNVATFTITEVNPDHAPDQADTFAQLIAVLADALS
jgi:arginase